MPKCEKCSNEFKRRVKINGSPILLSSTRASCLKCVPYKKMGAPRKFRREADGQKERQCQTCHKWLSNNQFRYETGLQCMPCRNSKAKPRTLGYKLQLKKRAVIHMGGRCHDCKQQFPLGVYDFHHLDPTQKDFSISKKTNFEEVKVELDKCVMLCKNCHSIRHIRNQGFMQIL